MCNQAAGLSRCLTRVQDAMSSQLKTLHLDKTKGKSSERMKQAVDELDYLVTFNRSISQAMARTMQDLSEGVFISMANFTLTRRDSYLEYLYAGVKQDTLTALRTAPVHLHPLFPDRQGIDSKPGKVVASLQPSPRGRLRVPSHVNDNQCVEFVSGRQDSVYVSGQIGLNPSPVIAGDKKVTVYSHVDFCVAKANSVTGLPQKKGVNPN